MKKTLIAVPAALLLVCCTSEKIIRTEVEVIPQPSSVEIYEGEFLTAGAGFKLDAKFDEGSLVAVAGFESALSAASGVPAGTSAAKFVFKYDPDLDEEAYTINVTGKKAVVRASAMKGVLYALETLKQLLPEEVYTGTLASEADWSLPCMKIEDSPRFAYRGMHMDVSRHFFDMNQVKRYLDIMAIHKLNVLHWHLTDDQGWRIEIKKYPQLTQVGAVRNKTIIGHARNSNKYDNTPYGEGCWFSQDQIREIIDYAASKGIEIIPEIDLPGHMLAALATFPELGCTGGPYEVWGRWGISEDVLCVGKEATMQFLEDVLSEVADLFPSEYVHIGGDECPKVRWENCPVCQAKIRELGLKDDEKHSAEHYLQSYVTNRMETFLASKGKKVIGWHEILEGNVSKDITVMSWKDVKIGHEAAEQGYDVIMVPSKILYFDYYQTKDIDSEPLSIGGYVPVSLVYSFEPMSPDMSDKAKKHILGVQANLWTEYIATPSHLEYMLLPRLSALSEVQWCQEGVRNYDRFLKNMNHMSKIYEALDYTYARHIFED